MKTAITKMSKSKNYFQAKKPAASFATALAFALALLLAFPKNAAAQEDINFWSDYPNAELADALVSRSISSSRRPSRVRSERSFPINFSRSVIP